MSNRWKVGYLHCSIWKTSNTKKITGIKIWKVQKRRRKNKGGGQVPINIVRYVNHGIFFRYNKKFTIVIIFYKLDAKHCHIT